MWSRIADLAAKVDDVARAVNGGGEEEEEEEEEDSSYSNGGNDVSGSNNLNQTEIVEDGWGEDNIDDVDDFAERFGDDDLGEEIDYGDDDFGDDFNDDDYAAADDDMNLSTTTITSSNEQLLEDKKMSDQMTLLDVNNDEGIITLLEEDNDTIKAEIDSLDLPGFQTAKQVLEMMTNNDNLHPVQEEEVVTVSAPGKALIAGGYLVLEMNNPGVVLAAKGCRFHTTITFRSPYSDSSSSGVFVDNGDANWSGEWNSIPLDVYSPQFDKVFSYHLSYYYSPNTTSTYATSNNDSSNDITSIRLRPRMVSSHQHESNKFVERSLLLALGYIRQSMGANAFHARLQRHKQRHHSIASESPLLALAIKLRADNDFYSQITRLRERGLDLTPANLELLEPFLPCPKDDITGKVVVNKTGMGSSAALVASLVGAILLFFGIISLPSSSDNYPITNSNGNSHKLNNVEDDDKKEDDEEGLRIAHNLSQICHCYAQGKVGSGFDISSAIYGSHVYTRFSDIYVNKFLENVQTSSSSYNCKDNDDDDCLQLSGELCTQLVALVDTGKWDCTVTPISLPQGLELIMADVCGGSESPSMARKILEWKKTKRKVGFMDDYYWKDLKRCNKKIVYYLTERLTTQTVLDGLHRDGATIISTRTAEQWKKPMPSSWYQFEGSSWDVALKLFDLRLAFIECRQNLKGMGESAGVPVEPNEQTYVADATMALPGVVAAGVPGAGGHDALFVLYVKGPVTCDGKSDRVRDEIGNLWREMSNDGSNDRVLCPLSVRAAGLGDGLTSSQLQW